MILASETRFGPYEIVNHIGAGGMGEVYRAIDTRLDRTVAIKVLPDRLHGDSHRKERFKREAKVISSLNHPHICILHDVGEQDGTVYLVMEYIEGETLQKRLEKGKLPLDQTLEYAIQIAGALDIAHRKRIVHRDLKPGNIMLTKSGVKLLDFGLAKLKRDADPVSPISCTETASLSEPVTEEGIIVGTLQYMAPEQLEGKEVDARTDIFSFGALVYEMVTGRKAFQRRSQASLIAGIMESHPQPMSELEAMTPLSLDRLIQTCMAKDPADRWQSAGDLARQLKWIAEGSAQTGVSTGPISRQRYRSGLVSALIWVFLGAAAAGVLLWALIHPNPSVPQRVSIVVPVNAPVAFGPSPGLSLAISPDGTRVAYVSTRAGKNQIFVRSLDNASVHALPGTNLAFQPFFSPDGKWIAFFTSTELKKVSLEGGSPITLVQNIDGGTWGFGEWGEDNMIVFGGSVGKGLWRVSADGGPVQQVTKPNPAEGEAGHRQPALLDRSNALLFSVVFSKDQNPRIDAVMLDTGKRSVVVENAYAPRYLRSGHLLFQREGLILIAPFDPVKLKLTGTAIPLIDEVRREGFFSDGQTAQLAISRSGTLAYIPAISSDSRVLGWMSQAGVFQQIALEAGNLGFARVSPTGKQIALVLMHDRESEVHIYDLDRGTTVRLTKSGGENLPLWRPNGTELAVYSRRRDARAIYLKKLDGSEQLLVSAGSSSTPVPGSWSPDGNLLAYTLQSGAEHDIWILSMADEPSARPFLNTDAVEHSPMFSPDGQWLAYVSNESGRLEVYIQKYPQGEKLPVSAGGALGPVWSADGKMLFYQADDKMVGVPVSLNADKIRLGTPIPLFNLRVHGPTGLMESYSGSGNHGPGYDVGRDGRFLMIKRFDPGETREIVLVQNWFEELKERVPVQ
jgi:serine/threonine protein kinase